LSPFEAKHSAQAWQGTQGLASTAAMAAAQHVMKEILDATTQRDLLACMRSFAAVAGPVKCTRRQSLMDGLVSLCHDPVHRKSVCSYLLSGRTKHELDLLAARLKGGGCMVPLKGRQRKADMVMAIMETKEFAPRKTLRREYTVAAEGKYTSSKGSEGAPSSKGICLGSLDTSRISQGATEGASSSKGICLGSLDTSRTSQGATEGASSSTGICTGRSRASFPVVSMALVAFDTSADPRKMQRKLTKMWRKKWARFCKKKARKVTAAQVTAALQEALGQNTDEATVGDLRAAVAQELGIPLEGRRRLAFDQALSKLTAPAPKQRRTRVRFTLAKSGHGKRKF